MAGATAVRRVSSIKAKKNGSGGGEVRIELRFNPLVIDSCIIDALPASDFGPEEWSVVFGIVEDVYQSFIIGVRTYKPTGCYYYSAADYAQLTPAEKELLFRGEKMELGFYHR